MIRFVLAAVLIAVSGCAGSMPSRETAERDIRLMIDRYLAAYSSGEVDRLKPFYAEETVIWANAKPDIRGWDQIKANFAPSMAQFNIVAELDVKDLRVAGDLAFMTFITVVRITPKAGGETREVLYRDMAVLKHFAAGWKIVRNMDQPVTRENLR